MVVGRDLYRPLFQEYNVANLSYAEALAGVVEDEFMEPMLALVDNHKNWGAVMARLPSSVVVNLVEEVKRLREEIGGYKTIPASELDSI